MLRLRRAISLASAAPLALALAACEDKAATDTGSAPAAPVAAVPAPAGTAWREVVTVTEADGYLMGNPNAPIKLIEYASLTCPACAAFSREGAEELKEDYVNSGRVSFELRNQIHGPHDLALATLVRCGDDQTFHPLADQIWANLQTVLAPIMNNQAAVEQALTLSPEQRLVTLAQIGGFYDFFAARGLSEDQARTCLADSAVYTRIAENSNRQSEELQITGTPTFLINGRKLDGVGSWAQLEPALQRAGAR
jgi:protein-disulfide isomerase